MPFIFVASKAVFLFPNLEEPSVGVGGTWKTEHAGSGGECSACFSLHQDAVKYHDKEDRVPEPIVSWRRYRRTTVKVRDR